MNATLRETKELIESLQPTSSTRDIVTAILILIKQLDELDQRLDVLTTKDGE